jgi:hypothetical protein
LCHPPLARQPPHYYCSARLPLPLLVTMSENSSVDSLEFMKIRVYKSGQMEQVRNKRLPARFRDEDLEDQGHGDDPDDGDNEFDDILNKGANENDDTDNYAEDKDDNLSLSLPAKTKTQAMANSTCLSLTNMFGIVAAIHHQFPEDIPADIADEVLRWQMTCGGTDAAAKKFRTEVMLTQGLLVFGIYAAKRYYHFPPPLPSHLSCTRGGGLALARTSDFLVTNDSSLPQVQLCCILIKRGNGLQY